MGYECGQQLFHGAGWGSRVERVIFRLGDRVHHLIAASESLKRVLELLRKVAGERTIVLLLGESGVGKGLFARFLHWISPWARFPFEALYSGVCPEKLFESEVFGHEKGAFTGALAQRKGSLERAGEGTFFLDEVGDLPLSLQIKLLRVLDDGGFSRVGGQEVLHSASRMVVATHRDLPELVRQRRFREDFFHRINLFPVRVPPLRERREDIPFLVEHCVSEFSTRRGKPAPAIPPETVRLLMEGDWPGNVRELENRVKRMVLLDEDGFLTPEEFSRAKDSGLEVMEGPTSESRDSNGSPGGLDTEAILMSLREAGGSVTRAAGALGCRRETLQRRMKALGIRRCDL